MVDVVYVIWLSGGSCDGCSIAVLGATNPPVELLLAARVPGLPKINLIHPVLAYEAGQDFMKYLEMAAEGKLDPFVVVVEGSVANERLAGEGYFNGLGEKDGKPLTMEYWLERLSKNAAAVIAIGTCATWGGIPSANPNPTGAMGVRDFLGPNYRSKLGLPVINVPGCSPIGDNFVETVAAILLYLQGIGPAPQFDELGRPAWIFSIQTAHESCSRGGFYEEGVFAKNYGDKECLVTLGCWGPVVQCNVPRRGWINAIGGCMQMGGICIGCTMPGFPDKMSPFFEEHPGALISSTVSRVTGSLMRSLRMISMQDKLRKK
jgi:hydrogenase small subunit